MLACGTIPQRTDETTPGARSDSERAPVAAEREPPNDAPNTVRRPTRCPTFPTLDDAMHAIDQECTDCERPRVIREQEDGGVYAAALAFTAPGDTETTLHALLRVDGRWYVRETPFASYLDGASSFTSESGEVHDLRLHDEGVLLIHYELVENDSNREDRASDDEPLEESRLSREGLSILRLADGCLEEVAKASVAESLWVREGNEEETSSCHVAYQVVGRSLSLTDATGDATCLSHIDGSQTFVF
ncbi:MAG: hypothetical protein AAF645_00790 [Myxococcota bacterium]